ncbi:PLP-dependent aminotransferase family protein [Thermomonas aquatica]|uniref:PLP-dependent aminotransferase family protein n=1 Tax=Thermomonas aquatica TaxID=2202149 RepID=A0A5B7ZN95_9GAMM|nr:PLP-dependent aminotransferase family protein [Thermomonas aquatica]QDA56139.1 PLP-dependent aminotransferase family protein [Thermomonas aquatica]
MKRYQALAADIAASIRNGTLKPGDKLPSVRRASASRHLSPATVFQAYYLLEAKGLIRARDRSGYYVAHGAKALPPEPETASKPDGEARPVVISELVVRILESAMTRDVVPLGSAFPSPLLFPFERLGRATAVAMSQLDPWSTVSELAPGSHALRQQIALRYLVDGIHIRPEHIVVTNGAMEALNLCLSAVCKPGDAVLVESPCFYACLQALERFGLHAVEVATDPRDGIDLDALEAAIARHRPAACWLMTNYQNPLGSAMSEAKKHALAALVARHRLPLIEDDVYGELYFDNRRPTPTKGFDGDGWVMHCSSFSKTLAPGYRVGWTSPGRFLKQVTYQKLTTSLATSMPGQLGIARYLERGSFERHLRGLRLSLRKNRDEYIDAIGRHFPAGTKVSRPSGGYFLWLELPGAVDALALHDKAMAAGISIAPGPMFSASRGFGACIRVNYGHPLTARVEAALRTIGKTAIRLAA